MVDRESGHVCCDDCGRVLEHKAYKVDLAGCFCLDCAVERIRDEVTRTSKNTCAGLDTYDADDFWEGTA